jgi:hypothetical protein
MPSSLRAFLLLQGLLESLGITAIDVKINVDNLDNIEDENA